MILDSRTEFADATTIPTPIATAILGNVIDLGKADNLGAVDDLYLVVQIDTTVTSDGAATVQFHLVSDAQAALAVDGSATYHHSTAAIPKATLVGGYEVLAIPLPQLPIAERYMGVLATVGTAVLTAGKANAFLTNKPAFTRTYADAL